LREYLGWLRRRPGAVNQPIGNLFDLADGHQAELIVFESPHILR